MEMWSWVGWAIILMAQNASTTWASRARNSSSVAYHSLASSFSNGVWFISFTLLTNSVLDAAKGNAPWATWLFLFAFYTTFTVIGASLMHWISMTYLESGKRKVGS
jgi:hypothetical protein